MLPPPFLILPQAEINFNYFPCLAHYECQDNKALTLNKYVTAGMCLLECRQWEPVPVGPGLLGGVTGTFPSGVTGSGAAFAVGPLGTSCGTSLRSIPSPLGRQQALCVDIWK